MVDILSQQQNAVGFDSTENMETDKTENPPKPDEEKELDEGELPEEGEITEDEEESAPAEVHTSSSRSRGHTSSSHHHRSHHSPPRSSRSKPCKFLDTSMLINYLNFSTQFTIKTLEGRFKIQGL